MKPRKLTATAPDGTIHTRKTARTYTHVVMARACYRDAVRRANNPELRDQDRATWDRHAARAQGKDLHRISFMTPDRQAAYDQEQMDKGAAFIAANPDCEAYVDAQHKARVDAVEAADAAGEFTSWSAVTWCGRPDLANKAASQARGIARLAEVAIVPVNGGAL